MAETRPKRITKKWGIRMEESLYDKYGGFSTVSKVVHELYRRVLANDLLAPYFNDADMQRLMDHQTQFFSTLMGGPVTYTNEELDKIHKSLNIDERAFAELMDVLEEVLEDSGVAGGDVATIIGALVQYKPQIIGAELRHPSPAG